MLPKKPRRQDVTTLIWEYLDGGISPTRAERLSSILAERPDAREQMLESAVLQGMLMDYFKNDEQARAQRKRKSRRSSAA